MLVIAGLGNPGEKYILNRHNAGFMVVDEIARCHSFPPWKKKFCALITEGKLAEKRTILLKPQTMMNDSGAAISDAMRFYGLEAGDILVIHDELDLELARVRFKTGGGAGGHNGVKSVIAHCGKDFHRLRIGIGHPGDRSVVTRYVLGNFTRMDIDMWLSPLIQSIGEHADYIVRNDRSIFTNKISLSIKNEKNQTQTCKKTKFQLSISANRTKGKSFLIRGNSGKLKTGPGKRERFLKK